VLRIGQRLFALLRKSEDAIGQIAAHRKIAVFFMRFPGRFHFLVAPFDKASAGGCVDATARTD
jgi:hypothetical protein